MRQILLILVCLECFGGLYGVLSFIRVIGSLCIGIAQVSATKFATRSTIELTDQVQQFTRRVEQVNREVVNVGG